MGTWRKRVEKAMREQGSGNGIGCWEEKEGKREKTKKKTNLPPSRLSGLCLRLCVRVKRAPNQLGRKGGSKNKVMEMIVAARQVRPARPARPARPSTWVLLPRPNERGLGN